MLAALLVAGGAIVLVSDLGENPPRTSYEVLSAEGLVNSIGVNVHLGYADTAYADHPRILGRLRELGSGTSVTRQPTPTRCSPPVCVPRPVPVSGER